MAGLCPLGDIQLEFLGHVDGSESKKMELSGIHWGEKAWKVRVPNLQAPKAQSVSVVSSQAKLLGLGPPPGGVMSYPDSRPLWLCWSEIMKLPQPWVSEG